MRQVNNELARNLVRVGYIQALKTPPTIDEVIAHFKKNDIYLEYNYIKHCNKYCYRYYTIENKKESQKLGCRARKGYDTCEDALEQGIIKIVEKILKNL